MNLRIQLLGGFGVTVGSHGVADAAWRPRKARGLVKLLALAPGHRLGRDELLEALWPHLDPDAARNNFHQALLGARRALGPAVPLRLRGGMLALDTDGAVYIDVAEFEQAAADARRRGEPAGYRDALALYTGDLLPEDRYEDWAAARREALRETFLQLLADVARLDEARGEYGAAIEVLGRVVAVEPAHEEAHAGLMRLYALTGQRGQALRQWAHLTDALRRELDAEPDRASRRLYGAILAGRFPPAGEGPGASAVPEAPQAPPRRHNLPAPLSRFIGRSRECAALGALLAHDISHKDEQLLAAGPGRGEDRPRLVTLIGAGGCGKTRLALVVAHSLTAAAPAGEAGRYPGGIWLAELAGLADPALVPGAVALALGVREELPRPLIATLIDRLRPRAALLVLDNCEHLIDACARLAQALLEGCPDLRILATSREALHLPGELTWRVPSLTLPDPGGAPTPAHLAGSEAVQLLIDRIRWRQPGFALTAANAPAVAEVCRRLDGTRWRSNWRRRGRRPWRSSNWRRGWTMRWGCSRPAAAPRPRGSGRCARRWTGATTCCPGQSGGCWGGWRPSRAALRWRRPRRSARATAIRPRWRSSICSPR